MPFVEVVGKDDKVLPEQIGVTWVNVGIMLFEIVIFIWSVILLLQELVLVRVREIVAPVTVFEGIV